MNFSVLTQRYDTLPPFCEKEILRYAGCKKEDPAVLALMHSAMEEAAGVLTYRVCHCRLSVTLRENVCDFGFFSLESRDLSQYLSSCEWTSVFAATVGVGLDRLIARYSRLSPARALMLQAIGAERIEALCDFFCDDEESAGAVLDQARFSPGYGDLSLSVQKEIFSLLECEKRVGLCLNDSLLMSPSKSVTAFARPAAGASRRQQTKCLSCSRQDCEFRGKL